MNWRVWLKGLVAAVVGGAAGSVGMVIVDPMTYNIQEGWINLVKVMGVMAIVSAAMYLKQSPLPPDPPAPEQNKE